MDIHKIDFVYSVCKIIWNKNTNWLLALYIALKSSNFTCYVGWVFYIKYIQKQNMSKKKGGMRRIRQAANQWRILIHFGLKSFGWLIDEFQNTWWILHWRCPSTIVTVPWVQLHIHRCLTMISLSDYMMSEICNVIIFQN